MCFASGKIESLSTISLFSRVHGSERLQAACRSRTRDFGSPLLSAAKIAPAPNASLVDSLHLVNGGRCNEGAAEGAEGREEGETVCRSGKTSDHSNESSTGSSFTRRRFVGRTGEGETSRSRRCSIGRESRPLCVEEVGGRPPQSKGKNKCAAGRRSFGFLCLERARRQLAKAWNSTAFRRKGPIVQQNSQTVWRVWTVPGAPRFNPNPSQDVCHLQEVIRGLQAEVATLRAATVFRGGGVGSEEKPRCSAMHSDGHCQHVNIAMKWFSLVGFWYGLRGERVGAGLLQRVA